MWPVYPHDCKRCILLGHWEEHDLYFCPEHKGGTVKARYGSRFWEVLSEEPAHPAISEARRMAQKQGFILRQP